MMRVVRQLGSGLFYGLVSVLLVVGGLSLALAESYTAPSPAPTPSLPAVPQTLTSTQAGPTFLPSSTSSPTATPAPAANCRPPGGWILISVQPSETLEDLAARFRIAPYELARANCLFTDSLEPGFNIYVPPPPTSPPISCGAPYGWVRSYVVQPGDTLYHIAALYGTSIFQLQRANCLPATFLTPGDLLWVPNVPPLTPSVIVILIFGTVTPAFSPAPPTATNSPAAIPSSTFTPTVAPSATSTP